MGKNSSNVIGNFPFPTNSGKTLYLEGGVIGISVWDQLSELAMTLQKYYLWPFLTKR